MKRQKFDPKMQVRVVFEAFGSKLKSKVMYLPWNARVHKMPLFPYQPVSWDGQALTADRVPLAIFVYNGKKIYSKRAKDFILVFEFTSIEK